MQADKIFNKLENLTKSPNPPLIPKSFLLGSTLPDLERISLAAQIMNVYGEILHLKDEETPDPNKPENEQSEGSAKAEKPKASWCDLVRKTIGLGPSTGTLDDDDEEK